jgi:MFS family permease
MLMLLAVGLGSYFFAQNYLWVLLLGLIWSQGLHVWMPLPNSMTLALAEPGRAGHRLGQIQAAGAAGFGGGLIVALVLTLVRVPMRPMYLLAGTMAILAAASCLRIPRQIKAPGPRLVFRRRYGLYYILSLLEGWRRQISMSFAGFLLVKVYHTKLEIILLLWTIVQVIGYIASPRVGRLIDRIGERRILLFYYSCLTAFFAGYALIPIRLVLYGVFVIDGAFFVFAMALTTYVNRIAPKSEHTPTLSMGVAMNHVAAVTMPFVGGILWESGHQWTFLIGTAAAVLSIGAAMRLPKK